MIAEIEQRRLRDSVRKPVPLEEQSCQKDDKTKEPNVDYAQNQTRRTTKQRIQAMNHRQLGQNIQGSANQMGDHKQRHEQHHNGQRCV